MGAVAPNHDSAAFIMEHMDPDLWSSYFKFCFERNPWDKVISYFFWRHRDGRKGPLPPVSQFIQSGSADDVKGFELYSRGSEIVVDEVFFYEDLERALGTIRDRLGLEETPSLPAAKTRFRTDRRHYREVLDQQDRDRIARIYAREITHFGYEW